MSVQCAGISLPSKNVVDMDVAEFDKTISVNLRGGALGFQLGGGTRDLRSELG